MKEIDEILKTFGSSCYWYGEDTGDDDMRKVEEEEFYKEAKAKILNIVGQEGKDEIKKS